VLDPANMHQRQRLSRGIHTQRVPGGGSTASYSRLMGGGICAVLYGEQSAESAICCKGHRQGIAKDSKGKGQSMHGGVLQC
jgi:hypothetical protein